MQLRSLLRLKEQRLEVAGLITGRHGECVVRPLKSAVILQFWVFPMQGAGKRRKEGQFHSREEQVCQHKVSCLLYEFARVRVLGDPTM
jgi:hypothetical protein